MTLRLAIFAFVLGCSSTSAADIRAVDLVFHRSTSAQAEVIAGVTGSQLTHVGIVLPHDGELAVLEAVQPVWLIHEGALDRELVAPQTFGDLVLTDAARRLARRRLGRLPRATERIVTPVALAQSPTLFEP